MGFNCPKPHPNHMLTSLKTLFTKKPCLWVSSHFAPLLLAGLLLLGMGCNEAQDSADSSTSEPTSVNQTETPEVNPEFAEFLSYFPEETLPLTLAHDRPATGKVIPTDVLMPWMHRSSEETRAEMKIDLVPGYYSLIIAETVRGHIWYELVVFNAAGEKLIDEQVGGNEDGTLYDGSFATDGTFQVILSQVSPLKNGGSHTTQYQNDFSVTSEAKLIRPWGQLDKIQSFEQLAAKTGGTYWAWEDSKQNSDWAYRLYMKDGEFVVEECKAGNCQERGRAANFFVRKDRIQLPMKGIEGELVPVWTLKEIGAYGFNLEVHDYDVETDQWFDQKFSWVFRDSETAPLSSSDDPGLCFIKRELFPDGEWEALPAEDQQYRMARWDLNEDGKMETLVTVPGIHYCGSGGCTFWVLNPTGELISKTTVADFPIGISSKKTNGWFHLLTWSNGSHRALTFDGEAYSSNASTAEAISEPTRTRFSTHEVLDE